MAGDPTAAAADAAAALLDFASLSGLAALGDDADPGEIRGSAAAAAAGEAVGLADFGHCDFLEIESWTAIEASSSGASIDNLFACGVTDPAGAEQQELDQDGSYWYRAEETGLFMETTAECFPAELGSLAEYGNGGGGGWMLRAEEQSTVQVILSITDHHVGGGKPSSINTDKVQIPLLELALQDDIMEQSHICLDEISRLFDESDIGTALDQLPEMVDLGVRDEPSVSYAYDIVQYEEVSPPEAFIPPVKIEEAAESEKEEEEQAESVVDSCSFMSVSSDSVDQGVTTKRRSSRSSSAIRYDESDDDDGDYEDEIVSPPAKKRRRSSVSSVSSSGYDHKMKKKKAPNLPAASVTILRNWLDAHLRNPYPTSDEKAALAARARLDLSQVENWMSNQRARFHIQKAVRSR